NGSGNADGNVTRSDKAALPHAGRTMAAVPETDFEEVYREYLPRIYAFCLAQLRSEPDAEDVTAIVFINAYRAYGRFEMRHSSPAPWLFTIARNAIRDHARASVRRDRLQARLEREREVAQDPEAMAGLRAENRRLLDAIAG